MEYFMVLGIFYGFIHLYKMYTGVGDIVIEH